MAKKKQEDCPPAGAPAWMATYGDMMTLLLCFFVLLFSMSSVDVAKFKAAMSSFADQIDIMPGGETLTDGELLNNGISQLNDVQITFTGGMPINTDEKDIEDSNPLNEDNEDIEDKVENDNTDVEPEMNELDKYGEAERIAKLLNAMIQEEGFQTSIDISLTSNYVKLTLSGEFLFDSGKASLKPQAIEAITKISEELKEENYNDYDIEIAGHTDDRPVSGQYPNNWILSSYRAYAVLEELTENHGFDPEKVAGTGYGEYRPIADNETEEGRALNRRVEIKVVLDTDEVSLEEITIDQLEEQTNIKGEDTETLPEGEDIDVLPEGEQPLESETP